MKCLEATDLALHTVKNVIKYFLVIDYQIIWTFILKSKLPVIIVLLYFSFQFYFWFLLLYTLRVTQMKAYKVMFVISLQAWCIHQGSNNRWVCQAEVQKCSHSWSWVSCDTVYLPNSFYVLICESVMVLGLLTSVSGYCILIFPQSHQLWFPPRCVSVLPPIPWLPCVYLSPVFSVVRC